MGTILITGGSGLIGTALTVRLRGAGHQVRWIGRSAAHAPGVRTFAWSSRSGAPDEAVQGVDHVVHLAGAPIASGRWTAGRVRELIRSRASGPQALLTAAQRTGWRPRAFISASGAGWYGCGRWTTPVTENAPHGTDTISGITTAWEQAVDEWVPMARVVKLRTPVVLAREGGALPLLARVARLGLASPLGRGDQAMPWVHLGDLVEAYMTAIMDDTMQGAYNVAAPEHTDNRSFMRTLSHTLHRPFVLPAVPAPVLRLVLGGIADTLLGGGPLDTERLRRTGWCCAHPSLAGALRDLLPQ